MTSIEQSLQAWGNFDRDNPFPLFEEVRRHGPVQKVTLADGHDAWLIVGYEEAKAALNDPRISKDMQAAMALAGGVVAQGLPGPAFARHMLAVDPPDHTRLRRLVAAAFSVRRIEALQGDVEKIVTSRLDAIAAEGPDTVVDLVPSFAFPLPFTVICQLLGVPESWRAAVRPIATGDARADAHVRGARNREGRIRQGGRDTRRARRTQAKRARRSAGQRVDQRTRRRGPFERTRADVDDLPADHRRSRHDIDPHRKRRRRVPDAP